MLAKSHLSAVVVIPPETAWGPIQAIRRHHDRQVDRWMPHLNLLYPFVPAEHFVEAGAKLEEICSATAPFGVVLGQFRFFTHPSRRSTIWLEPEPRPGFMDLHARLLRSFPQCDDTAQHPGGFTPHLSVGQADGPEPLRILLEDFQQHWDPLYFNLERIALIHREEHGPFRVVREFGLGGRGERLGEGLGVRS